MEGCEPGQDSPCTQKARGWQGSSTEPRPGAGAGSGTSPLILGRSPRGLAAGAEGHAVTSLVSQGNPRGAPPARMGPTLGAQLPLLHPPGWRDEPRWGAGFLQTSSRCWHRALSLSRSCRGAAAACGWRCAAGRSRSSHPARSSWGRGKHSPQSCPSPGTAKETAFPCARLQCHHQLMPPKSQLPPHCPQRAGNAALTPLGTAGLLLPLAQPRPCRNCRAAKCTESTASRCLVLQEHQAAHPEPLQERSPLRPPSALDFPPQSTSAHFLAMLALAAQSRSFQSSSLPPNHHPRAGFNLSC